MVLSTSFFHSCMATSLESITLDWVAIMPSQILLRSRRLNT